MLSVGKNSGETISTRSPLSNPFVTGTFTAVVSFIIVPPQQSDCVSLDKTEFLGKVAAVVLDTFTIRIVATKFCGILCGTFAFIANVCVCDTESIMGIAEL